ncbi:MAG: hypothetical protein RLZ00_437 [Pseudomonadota bacterium]|jgi:hypothetical protein
MSGLSRTPGKRVWVNSPPRVRIPLAPPITKAPADSVGAFSFGLSDEHKTSLAATLLSLLDDSFSIGVAVGGY